MAIFLLLVAAYLGLRPDTPTDPVSLGLCALGIALSVTEIRRPGIGFFSVSPALYMAAAELGHTRQAALAALAGVTLRTLVNGRRWREALYDAVAWLTPVAILASTPGSPAWLRAALALQGYLLAALWLSRGLATDLPPERAQACERSWAQLALPTVAVACLGIALGLATPLGALCLLITLAILRLQATHFVLGTERQLWQQAESELGREQSRRVRVEDELHQAQDAHRVAVELGRTLGSCAGLQPTADALVRFVHARLERTSVVLFQGPEPIAYVSPRAEQLRDHTLLALGEPLVEEAARTGRVCRRSQSGSPLFPDEPEALAWPLGGFGALYVGGRQALSPAEGALLGLVTHQGGWALELACRLEQLEASGQQLARSNQRLGDWLAQLDPLVSGLRALSTQLDPETLLSELETQLQALVPHDFRVLEVDGETRAHPPDLTGWHELAQNMQEWGRPLLLEGENALVPGQRSLLAVPLTSGFLILGRTGDRPFRRQDQHLLDVLGYQVGLAMRNARLHSELALSYDDLRESQAQVVQSSKLAAVGQLAAGVAHELNTPLASALLSVQGAKLNLKRDPSLAPPKLELADQELRRAQEIVSNLLAYSRDSRGGRRPCVLQEVVRETLILLSGQTGAMRIAPELPEPPLELTCNPSEVKQVLLNLLLNARDAGATQLTLRARGEGGEVVLEVADNGEGMTPEVLARAFDPFFTTRPVGKGTGLGLSVSARLVEAHGGRLLCESQPGQGARFTLRLPR